MGSTYNACDVIILKLVRIMYVTSITLIKLFTQPASYHPMYGENQLLVPDKPVKFEK